VRDVTGDGRDEILILDGDGVECRDARGQRLWALDGYARPQFNSSTLKIRHRTYALEH
jgi:hypothetical protein